MNLSPRDMRIIEKAVSFFISRHFDGVNEESEKNNRESALRALETLKNEKEQLPIEEVRALFVALTKFADEMSEISVYNDKPTIERAYQLADEFWLILESSGH